jgi:hypothetical protein
MADRGAFKAVCGKEYENGTRVALLQKMLESRKVRVLISRLKYVWIV